jgi:outer membrane receptor for ferrienterochelin and colicin
MFFRLGAPLIASLLLAANVMAVEPVTIGVLEFVGMQGVSQDAADVMADIIAKEIGDLGGIRVVSKTDIRALLNLEKKKRLAGCSENECFAEIAGALGMPWMVTGNISRFGKSYILNLKLMDVRNFVVSGRISRRIKGDEEALLDDLPHATHYLFEKVADRIGIDFTPKEVKSASKHRQPILWSPSAITVFTREQIRASGAMNIPDLLRRVPGFDVYEIKAAIPLVGTRALTDDKNNRILLLIDGREDMMEITGYPIWGTLAVGLDQIERMEVIRGPGSALYGANAFAGVINITTVPEKSPFGGYVRLTGGEQGSYLLSGSARGEHNLLGGNLSLGLHLGAGQRFGTSAETRESGVYHDARTRAFVRYRKGNELDISLHGGFFTGGGMVYIIIGDISAVDFTGHYATGKARMALGESVSLKLQIYQNRYYSKLLPRSRIWALGQWVADLPDMDYDSNSVDGQAQLDVQLAEQLLLIGGCNLRYTWLEIPQFVDSVNEEVRGAVFMHAEWRPWDSIQFTGGLRFDINTMTEVGLSPRMAFVYRPWEDQSFRLSYGLAFRKPSMLELVTGLKIEVYNPSMPEIVDKMTEAMGNRDLTNEKVHSLEAGWRGRLFKESLDVSVDLFANVYSDTIRLNTELALTSLGTPSIDESVIKYENLPDEILALGGEVAANWSPAPGWNAWGNLSLRRVTWLESRERLESEPVFRANLGLGWLPERGIRFDLAAHYVSSYRPVIVSPSGLLESRFSENLGDCWLGVGTVGYRWNMGSGYTMEAGATIRTPLGTPFREYPGMPYSYFLTNTSRADFGGEYLMRLASLYVRGTY